MQLTAPPPVPALVALAAATCACRAPLHREPWSLARAGSFAVYGTTGVWEDYETDADFTFDSNFGKVVTKTHADLIGRFMLGGGVEWTFADDTSLLFGAAHRVFDAAEIDPAIHIDRIRKTQIELGVRRLLPWRWTREGRLRPWLQATLAYVPRLSYDTELDFSSIGQPNQDIRFDGSPYATLGASAGLSYQLSDRTVAWLGVVHEWPLARTSDDVRLDLLGSPLDVEVELEPRGWIAFLGVSWSL